RSASPRRPCRSPPRASGSGRRARAPPRPSSSRADPRRARDRAPARRRGRRSRGRAAGCRPAASLPRRGRSSTRPASATASRRRRRLRRRTQRPRRSLRPGPAASFRAQRSPRAAAIILKVMPSYRELLAQVKAEIDEVDAAQARELHEAAEPPLFLDVREDGEWDEGGIPGAVHIPRGNLESRVESAAPDRARPIVVYCAVGARSAFAAKSLGELGYENVVSLAGGYTEWKRNGFPTQLPATLDPEKRARYSRHLLIPEVGVEGQLKLLESRVLLIGAGGLGSPASLYLAAAGVGRLGIVDDDRVDASNLQRQIA